MGDPGFSAEASYVDLPDTQTILDLFSMTPYYYKTGVEDQKKLERLNTLQVTAHFHLLTYRVL